MLIPAPSRSTLIFSIASGFIRGGLIRQCLRKPFLLIFGKNVLESFGEGFRKLVDVLAIFEDETVKTRLVLHD